MCAIVVHGAINMDFKALVYKYLHVSTNQVIAQNYNIYYLINDFNNHIKLRSIFAMLHSFDQRLLPCLFVFQGVTVSC